VKEQPNNFSWHLGVVAIATCVGLTAGAYALGVRPMLQQRELDQTQRQTLDQRRSTATKQAETLANLQRDLAEMKDALARTPIRLQSATLVNQRLEAVARVATECGVGLDEMRPGSAVDSTHFQTVPIRIVGNGTYPACATFLRRLRRTFGDMGVRTYHAGNNSPTNIAPTATFQAELVWFTALPRK
jgi:Tfp pilus assembly protein PilO